MGFINNTLLASTCALLWSVCSCDKQELNGIDISHHQGNVDWTTVANDGRVQYVYLKATEGATMQDSMYIKNRDAARNAGLKVGAYHYMTMMSSAKEQFENFTNVVGQDIDLLPMLDLEPSKRKYSLETIRLRADSIMGMMVAHYGVKPMLYCTRDRYYIVCDDAQPMAKPYRILPQYRSYPLFWGQYSSSQPSFDTENNCVIWQYSDQNHLDGLAGAVDFSKFVNGHSITDIVLPREIKK